METRNITLSLPAELIRKAKIYAAGHDTTVNRLVRDLLLEALTPRRRAQQAADRLLALADRGPHFKADPGAIRREELHARR